MSGIVFADSTVTYNGSAHSIVATGNIPAGASVTYAGHTDTLSPNSAIGANKYVITVTITCDNYNTYTSTATLTINKAKLDIKLNKTIIEYDGKAHSVTVNNLIGTIPDGLAIKFSNNTRTEVGTQDVTVVISGDNYETLTLTSTLQIKAKNQGSGITTPPHYFVPPSGEENG